MMKNKELDDTHLFVLQKIESSILGIYETESTLIDYDALNVVEALISYYVASIRNKEPKPHNLTGKTNTLFEGVKNSIENEVIKSDKSISVELIIECLKKIRGSIKFWTKERGRQGYLNYVSQFL
jgi:hypothetical protein